MSFTHLILTRFSVRASASSPPATAEWLRYRLELLDAYCLPSLAAQTSAAFQWLVLCDESTERWCLDALHERALAAPQLAVVATAPGSANLEAVVGRAGAADSVLVTTRVDSDDATSTDLVERVQAYVPAFEALGSETTLVNFCRGFKLDERRGILHEFWHPHSPHLTLFERLGTGRAPTTVLSGNHGYMQDLHQLHVDAGPPAWLQVIHGGNVVNRTYGAWVEPEVPLSALDGRFCIRRSEPREPVPAALPARAAAQAEFRRALEETLTDDAGA